MGQRLTIKIRKNNTDIACIYYHWSAYSMSSMYEIKKVLDVIYDEDSEIKNLQLRLIRAVESWGGCIDGGQDSDEFKEIQKMYPDETFKGDGSRNEGLIALTCEGIESMEGWSEGPVTIDLNNNSITNYVHWEANYKDDYLPRCEDWEEEPKKLEDIPDIGMNICDFDIDKFDEVYTAMNSVDGYICRNGETIFEFVA